MSRSAMQPDDDLVGTTILGDRYLLLEELGGGAFGRVYRAEESALGSSLRTVAIKLTRRRHLSPQDVKNLLHEGRTLARVLAKCTDARARKHLVHVYALGISEELQNRGYIVMEYVKGIQMLDHIRSFDGAFPLRSAQRYFRELCTAVGACHTLDPPIAHGDLKPDNVLVDGTGTLRIADFGLARPLDRPDGSGASGGGAMQYTAPETLLGKTTVRSDIYSIGLIMYEVLTGKGPHLEMNHASGPGREAAYYEMKRKLSFAPAESVYAGVDRDDRMFELVDRCVQFHHADRPASTAEILGYLNGEGDLAPQEVTRDEWLGRLREYADARTPAEGRAFLARTEELDCAAAELYRVLFQVQEAPRRDSLQLGLQLVESSRHGVALEDSLRLLQALVGCARELGEEPVALYLEQKMRDRAGEGR